MRKSTLFESVISDLTPLESAMDKEMFELYKTGLPVLVVRIPLLREVGMSHTESCRPPSLDFGVGDFKRHGGRVLAGGKDLGVDQYRRRGSSKRW